MLKPICVPCQRFFRMKRSGFYFTEGMPNGAHLPAEPGNTHPEQWRPYKLWVGDLWECKGCGAKIVSGFGGGPIRVQHHQDFADEIKRLGANQFTVNDC